MTLEKDQKDWITNVVNQLGSVEKVVGLYNKKCDVDKFANVLAVKLFKKEAVLRGKITYRSSSSKPNFQNIPKTIKEKTNVTKQKTSKILRRRKTKTAI